ncbi:hypothetical protein [Methylomonas albis]|nr:hypothetical protein [Methylomonas albis]
MKKLVEQAWSLEESIRRLIEQNCNRCNQNGCCTPSILKDRLNRIYEKTHARYKRRLQKLWS